MLAPDSIHEFIEAPANLGGGTQFLLKLYWRLKLAVGIAHFLITALCMGGAVPPLRDLRSVRYRERSRPGGMDPVATAPASRPLVSLSHRSQKQYTLRRA